MTPGAIGDDTVDDVTSMNIGFGLYHKYGRFAGGLTAQHILDALEFKAENKLPHSRDDHWCWNIKNPERIPRP